MAEAPNSYTDPYWTNLAAQAEARNGVPPGVLQGILLYGERSNNDQVSSSGARTPFQIIPSTRALFLKKYGVDAYLSPENAATVGALHVKESLDRGASVPRAVAEYYHGPDPSKWDKTVPGYVNRVLSGMGGTRAAPSVETTRPTAQSTFDRVFGAQQPQAENSLAKIYGAYQSGAMSAEDAAQFEADVNAGRVMLPRGGQLIGKDTPKVSGELPAPILQAYKEGRMLREDMIDLEKDVAAGMWTLPKGEKLGQTEGRGIVGSVKEAFTGADRRTPAISGMPDYTQMPEWKQPSFKRALAGIGSLTSGPQEIAKIMQTQFPEITLRQDEKGNPIMRSPTDGQEYAVQPGAQPYDALRAAATVLAFTPAGRATTIAGSAAGSAATQAAIEGARGAAGGDMSAGNVALAGGVGAAIPAVARAVQAVRSPAETVLEAEMPAVFRSNRVETPPVFRSNRTHEPVTFDETGVPVPSVRPEPLQRRATDASPSVPAAPVAPAASAETVTAEQLGKLVQTASGEGMGAVRAQEQIAVAARVNKDALAAAQRLGIELPADVFGDSQLVREAVGLTRSLAGSTASASWRDAVQNAARKADEVIGSLDASPNVAAVSDKVRGALTGTRDELKATADKVYGVVNSSVKESANAQFPATSRALSEVRRETPNTMSAQETRIDKLIASDNATYGDLRRIKDAVGDAIAGRQNDFSGMARGPLKKLYGALADDQIANVERIGGAQLANDLREANKLYSQKYALDKRIVNAFGRDNNGSIAGVMRQAIESGSKGDVKALNNLLDIVPKDLHKETVASALMSAARAKGGSTRGDFGFSEFNKLYTGLRQNEPVYARVVAALGGKDAHNLLSDLNTISKRVTDARANVLTTGKANQALVGAMKAEGLIASLLGKVPGTMAGIATYAAGGRWAGAMLARNTVNALAAGKHNVMESAGKMFSSPEFQKLMTEAATGTPKPETVSRFAISKRFSEFARQVGLPREMKARERWIMQAMLTGNAESEK